MIALSESMEEWAESLQPPMQRPVIRYWDERAREWHAARPEEDLASLSLLHRDIVVGERKPDTSTMKQFLSALALWG
jgi:hypothetical protein